MGFVINGFIGGDIDASNQTKSGQVTTDTTTQNTSADPSQETESYDFTEESDGPGGNPETTSDKVAGDGTEGLGQSGGKDSSAYNPSGDGGANPGGTGGNANQSGSTSFETGGTGGGTGGNGTGTDMQMTSGGEIKAGGTDGNGPELKASDGPDASYEGGNAGRNTAGGSNTGMGKGEGTEIKVAGTGMSMYAPEDIPDNEYFFHDGRAYIITGHDVDGTLTAEDITDDFVAQLSSLGIEQEDINKILNGQITVKQLFEEIQADEIGSERYKKLVENSMIQSIRSKDYPFFVFNSMEELDAYLSDKETELAKLIEERNKADDHELDAVEQIITKLNEGYTLEQALNQPVAWSYVDSDTGETKYVYSNPYDDTGYKGNYGSNYMYTPLTYEEMYGDDSEYLQQIKEHCYEQTIDHWFRDDEVVHRWDNNDEATREFYLDMLDKVSEHREGRAKRVAELDARIDALVSEIEYCRGVKNYVENEYLYYENNIRKYTRNDDFLDNCSYDPANTDYINNIIPDDEPYAWTYNGGPQTKFINNKEDIVRLILAMANGEIPPSAYVFKNGQAYQYASDDPLLQHYIDWLSQRDGEGNLPLSEEEIAVLNYIMNTSEHPIDELYDYLNFINDEEVNLADKLDERWLYRQQELDQEFADKHPFLASLWSVIGTPFEGISAAIHSYSAVTQGYKIARCDVYSSGDTMRQRVSYNIGDKYGETWQFVYDTGMSMADSLTLIAVTYFTGGAGLAVNAILSATLMGSRAYVSTLNESLDRGLTDAQAVLLATTSAIVETAMESYSLGHLMNLEGALGSVTKGLAGRCGDLFTSKAAQDFVSKLIFCVAGSISQGIAEGEEELCTELLNTVFDIFIAKDKSKIEVAAEHYKKLGLTDEEIGMRLRDDFRDQLIQAFKGGFFSGLVFGAFGSAKTTALTSYGIANGMYEGHIDTSKTASQQFIDAINYNVSQQEASEKVNGRYSIREVIGQIQSGASFQEILQSLKGGTVFNNAVAKQMNGEELTKQEQEALDAYKLIEFGLVEQQAKRITKEEIIRRISAIFHGFEAPSIAETVKVAQEYSGPTSLYSGQFHPPGDLSNITREQQIYNDTLLAMVKTGERLNLTTVGALRQMDDYVRTGQKNLITTRGNCRSIISQYSISEVGTALGRIKANITNNMNVDIQNAIDNVAKECKITPAEASRLVEAYIKGQQLQDIKFPKDFNYSELETIKVNYNIHASFTGRFDYTAIYEGIASYNKVLQLQEKMIEVATAYAGGSRFQTYEDVLTYLTEIGRTGNFQDLSRTITEPILYRADAFEFARAIERVNNAYFESIQITNILFTEFQNALDSGRKSDPKAVSLLYQTLSMAYTKGNPYAPQVIRTIMKIKQMDPNFCITSQTYSDCHFSSSGSNIEIGKLHTAMLDQGTIMHELGHALYYYISHEIIPTTWYSASQDARNRMTYDRNAAHTLGQLENYLSQVQQYCESQAQIDYEDELIRTKRKTIAQYQQSLARTLGYKAVFMKQTTIKNLTETLEKLGYHSKLITDLVTDFSKNGFDKNKAAQAIIDANLKKISERIARTQYSDACALSDIISALTFGRNQDLRGRQIFVTYRHSADYYDYYDYDSGKTRPRTPVDREIAAYHEIIANYTQLMLTGSPQNIHSLYTILGQDFSSMLYSTFTSNIEANQFERYADTINFVKVGEALSILDAVNNISATDVPIKFADVDTFHRWFIRELMNNGKFNSTVDTSILLKLLENPIFAQCLLEDRTWVLDVHLEEASKSISREQSIFSVLTPTHFSTYLYHSRGAANLIQNMSPTQLGNLLTNMGSNTYSWMESPTIKNTIFGYNAEQLSEFLDSCSSLDLNVLYSNLGNSQWSGVIDSFYTDLISNFVNMNYLGEHPELAPKLNNIIPAHSNSQICETAFKIVDGFQYVYMRVQALQPGSQNFESNKRIINDIKNTTSPPAIFSTSEIFKEVFLNTLMKSPIYSQLGNDITFELIKDPVFLNKLAGSAKIDSLLTKNLDTDSKARMLLPYLTSGTQQSFDKIMNTSAMRRFINSMTATELETVISRMKDTQNWWIANDAIVSTIATFDAGEMTSFLEGLNNLNIKSSVIDNRFNPSVAALFEKLTQVTSVSDFESNSTLYYYVNELFQSLGNYSSGIAELDSKIFSLGNNLKTMKENIAHKVVASAPQSLQTIMTIDSDSTVTIKADSSYKYYNLTIEVNGETSTIRIPTPFSVDDKVDIDISSCFRDSTVVESIISGNFKIISFTPNLIHDILYVRNLQPGLYQGTYVVDGIEYKVIKKSMYGSIDFGYDHQTGQTAELKSVEYLGDMKMDKLNGESLDDSSLYKMTYTEDGITKVIYLNSNGGVIDLNKIIPELKSHMDFSSLSIEKVENPQALFAGVKGLKDGLFSGTEYGGNQSNLETYLNAFFTGRGNLFEMDMGSRVSNMMDGFFPELTEMSARDAKNLKMRLAKLYANSGCGYMAFANAVTQYLSSIENGSQIYSQAFGIPMQIDGKYTEEFLAISSCLSGIAAETNADLSKLNSDLMDHLGRQSRILDSTSNYLSARGIKITAVRTDAIGDIRSSLLSTVLTTPNSFHIVIGSNFDLERLSTSQQASQNLDAALRGSTSIGRIKENVGGHAMLLTEITSSGEIIVSSWQDRYRFIPESLAKYKGSWSGMYSVDISLAQDASTQAISTMQNGLRPAPTTLSLDSTHVIEADDSNTPTLTELANNITTPIVEDVDELKITTKDVGLVRDFLEELKINPNLTFQEYLMEKTGHSVIELKDRNGAAEFFSNPAGILFNIMSNATIVERLGIKLKYVNKIDSICDEFRVLERVSPKRNFELLKMKIKSELKYSGLQLSEEGFDILTTAFAYKGLTNDEIDLEQMVNDFMKANEVLPILTEEENMMIATIMSNFDTGLYKKMLENMTEAERNAIYIYTIMDGYELFQQALKTPEKVDLASLYKGELGIDTKTSEALANLVLFINNNRIPATITTYQMAADFAGVKKRKLIDVGDSCKIGFKSTTISLEDLKVIASSPRYRDRNIILKIIVPEGSSASYVEPFSSVGEYIQNEVILGPNQELVCIQEPYMEKIELTNPRDNKKYRKEFVIVPCILY